MTPRAKATAALVDWHPHGIMKSIREACVKYGQDDNDVDDGNSADLSFHC